MDYSKILNIQCNNKDVQSYISGLKQWEKDIKKEDNRLSQLTENLSCSSDVSITTFIYFVQWGMYVMIKFQVLVNYFFEGLKFYFS